MQSIMSTGLFTNCLDASASLIYQAPRDSHLACCAQAACWRMARRIAPADDVPGPGEEEGLQWQATLPQHVPGQ
eukprot:11080276-Alexandrium_andersonii.AAC.1